MNMLQTTRGALLAGTLLYLLTGGLTWLILNALGLDAPVDMSSDVAVEQLMAHYQLGATIGMVASVLIVVLPSALAGWLSPARPTRTALLFAAIAILIQAIAWLLWLLLATHNSLESTLYSSVGLFVSLPLQFAFYFVVTAAAAAVRQRTLRRVQPDA